MSDRNIIYPLGYTPLTMREGIEWDGGTTTKFYPDNYPDDPWVIWPSMPDQRGRTLVSELLGWVKLDSPEKLVEYYWRPKKCKVTYSFGSWTRFDRAWTRSIPDGIAGIGFRTEWQDFSSVSGLLGLSVLELDKTSPLRPTTSIVSDTYYPGGNIGFGYGHGEIVWTKEGGKFVYWVSLAGAYDIPTDIAQGPEAVNGEIVEDWRMERIGATIEIKGFSWGTITRRLWAFPGSVPSDPGSVKYDITEWFDFGGRFDKSSGALVG